jgi:hypothetical protein
MTALRLSRLQKRLLHGFDAESQRTNGGIARSPQELGLLRHPDTGNSSRSRRPLDRGGRHGADAGGKAATVIRTPGGHKGVSQCIYGVKKK